MSHYDPIADAEETADITKNVQRMVAEQQGTPTPRTDAHRLMPAARSAPKDVVDADFARQLERELSAARAERILHERAAHDADLRTQAAVRAEKSTREDCEKLREALESFMYEFGDKANSATVNKAREALTTTRKEGSGA